MLGGGDYEAGGCLRILCGEGVVRAGGDVGAGGGHEGAGGGCQGDYVCGFGV